jgi:hypothetical protein
MEKYEIGGSCSAHGEVEKCVNILNEKPKGKRPAGRHMRRLEDNIKMDLRETGFELCELDLYGAGYGPVAKFCEHANGPLGSIKGGEFLD